MSDSARMILVNRRIGGMDHIVVELQTDHLDLIVHPVGGQVAQSDRLRSEPRSASHREFLRSVQQNGLFRHPLEFPELQGFSLRRPQQDQVQFASFPGAENAGQIEQPVTRPGRQCLRNRFIPFPDAAEDRTLDIGQIELCCSNNSTYILPR